MKTLSWRRLLGLGIVLLVLGSCSPWPTPASTAWQQTVDALAALRPGQVPSHLLRADAVKDGSEFDPNAYFTVLTHLSLEPGYVLDYVYYYDGLGGLPVLYVRPADQPPYENYTAFSAAAGSPAQARSSYLDYVHADGTPESFFELVVLRINGGQFYIFWHAGYNDARLVCDRAHLEKLIAGLEDGDLSLPAGVIRSARKLDYTPTVEFQDDKVRVRVVTFSMWEGFVEEVYTLHRAFPHTLLDVQRKVLVPYDSGIQF